jgi:Cys-rich four helix bundle protein (predicted Tat secretion target)
MERRDFIAAAVGALTVSNALSRSVAQAEANAIGAQKPGAGKPIAAPPKPGASKPIAGPEKPGAGKPVAAPQKPGAGKPIAAPSADISAVIDSVGECLKTGQRCLAHCTDSFAAGHVKMAACQRALLNMLAICEATAKLAAYHSADPKDLKAVISACASFCRACAKACEPHARSAECKACHDSCVACAKACDAYAT